MPTTFKSTFFQDTELINASRCSSLVDYNFSGVTKNSTSVFLKWRLGVTNQNRSLAILEQIDVDYSFHLGEKVRLTHIDLLWCIKRRKTEGKYGRIPFSLLNRPWNEADYNAYKWLYFVEINDWSKSFFRNWLKIQHNDFSKQDSYVSALIKPVEPVKLKSAI
jgi:hypothetical protein